MKILILNPPFRTECGRYSRASRSPAIAKGGTFYYPIWLAYAAGVLEQAGHEVKLIDAPAGRMTTKGVLEVATDWKPGLAVVDVTTPSVYHDVELAAALKDAVSGEEKEVHIVYPKGGFVWNDGSIGTTTTMSINHEDFHFQYPGWFAAYAVAEWTNQK